jgi:hypothetical protein
MHTAELVKALLGLYDNLKAQNRNILSEDAKELIQEHRLRSDIKRLQRLIANLTHWTDADKAETQELLRQYNMLTDDFKEQLLPESTQKKPTFFFKQPVAFTDVYDFLEEDCRAGRNEDLHPEFHILLS